MVANLTDIQLYKLRAFKCVADVEDEGMDEGRFFVHLKAQYSWNHRFEVQHTKSFGSFKEANDALKKFK